MYNELELRAYVWKKAQPTYEHGYNYANLKVGDQWFSKVFSKLILFPVTRFFKAGVFTNCFCACLTAQPLFSSVLISNLIHTIFLWDEAGHLSSLRGRNFKTVICKDTALSRWQVPNTHIRIKEPAKYVQEKVLKGLGASHSPHDSNG